MKLRYRTPDGKYSGEFDGDIAECVAGLGQFQEVFEADTRCGCCGKENLRFRVRIVDDYRFTELACLDCNAALAFGQNKRERGGGLFPKRKDGERWLPNRGWKVFGGGAQPSAAGAVGKSAVPVAEGKW